MRELNLVCFITNLFAVILIGITTTVIPMLTRKSFLFGVKIPMEHQNDTRAKELRKNYITLCVLGTIAVLALAVAQYLFIPDMTLIAVLYFPFLIIAIQMAVYLPNWKKAVKLKAEEGWTVSNSVFADTKSSHSRGRLSDLPKMWYVLSLLIIFASVIAALIQYPGLPDQIPTHWDINMQPDAWTDKSYLAILMMPLINLGTTALMWMTGFMIVRAKLQIDPQNPALSFAQHRIYRRQMGHSIGFMTLGLAAMFAAFGCMSIFPDLQISFWAVIVLPFATMIPLIVVPFKSGQGGGRIKPKNIPAVLEGDNTPEKDSGRGDDKYWALGMFYHNPDDPAYIVEDRFGLNLGFNYSKLPIKIMVALGIIGFVVFYAWITVFLLNTTISI
ncbi:MAG: DUF1648 domain-containing protein [Oscillospiraceae bacterium]|nr:DUF1648 domain-containing protein [Oscillospiraceae bacterium]